MDDALGQHDATALAALVRAGERSPLELVDAAIARIEAVDATLNSVIHRQFERARREAAGLAHHGPFGGVPFLLKDYGAAEAGEPHHQGLRVAKDAGWRAATDSPVTEAFRAAGLVTVGRTNVPELALMGTTEPDAYGPTRNPWDLDRSPGGSSGGAGAAVAAGLVPVAHANDIAGSIRIPAAQCGLVGLKPTRGRVVVGRSWDPAVAMNTEGVVTRTVRDAAGLLDAVTDPAIGPWPAPALPGPLASVVGVAPGRLRVGVCIGAFNGAEVDEGCAAAANAAATLLEQLGHDVEQAWPSGVFEPDLLPDARTLLAVHTAADVAAWSAALGRELAEDDLEPITWQSVVLGRAVTGADVLALLGRQQERARAITSWWRRTGEGDGFDLLVTPTTAEPAPPLGHYKQGFSPGRASAFTRVFNVTGQPALSLPLGWPDDGLPRGVQLVACYGREDVLVRVGAQLERAAPWAGRHPPVHA
jgi:amidase